MVCTCVLCVYVRVCACVRLYPSICSYIDVLYDTYDKNNIYIYIYPYIYIHIMYIYIYIYTYVDVHVHMIYAYIYIPTCIYNYTYIHIYIYTYVYIYIYIYIIHIFVYLRTYGRLHIRYDIPYRNGSDQVFVISRGLSPCARRFHFVGRPLTRGRIDIYIYTYIYIWGKLHMRAL